MDAARESALAAQCIDNTHVVKFDFIGNHNYGISYQLVGGVKRCNGSLAVDNQLSCKVYVVESARQTSQALTSACDAAQEAAGEVVHELYAGSIGLNGKVNRIMYRRYKAVDASLRLRTVVGHSMNVYLFGLVVPVGLSVQHAHAPTLKLEFIDNQVGICLESIE